MEDDKNSKDFLNLDDSFDQSIENEDPTSHQNQAEIPLNQKVTSQLKLHKYFHQFLTLYNPFLIRNSLLSSKDPIQDNDLNLSQITSKFIENFPMSSQYKQLQGSFESLKTDEVTLNFMQKYQQFFRSEIEKMCLKSQRFEKTENFTTKLIVHDFNPSQHYEVVKLQIQLLSYKTEILILNQTQKSPFHGSSDIYGSGSFGRVYFVDILGEKVAIKSIPFQKKDENEQNYDDSDAFKKAMLEVIQEYFFVLLFSELEIGPQAKTIGGFDLIVFEDCVVFGSEICEELKTRECDFESLYSSLFKMHMLQIVHRDIKPANIMFSKSLNKCVFIDFGCSEVISETIGCRTLTKMVGTTAFCTDELLGLLKELTKRVDLYYNDLHALKKSIQVQKSKLKLEEETEQKVCIQSYQFQTYRLKYLLHQQSYTQFKFLWKLVNTIWPCQIEQIEIQLLKFYPAIKMNNFMKELFLTQISSNSMENLQLKLIIQNIKQYNSSTVSHFCLSFMQDKCHFYQNFYHSLLISDENPILQGLQLCRILANFINVRINSFKNDDIQIDPQKYCDSVKKQLSIVFFSVFQLSQIGLNKNQICIEEKIRVSEMALDLIVKIDPHFVEQLQLIFDCPIQRYQPINIFYHYFLSKIWPDLTPNLKQKSVSQIISTFCFLGFPVNSELSVAQVIMYFIQEPNSPENLQYTCQKRIQKIFYYWEARVSFLLFDKIFYSESKLYPKIKFGTQFQMLTQKTVQKLMAKSNHENQKFFLINNKLYKCLVQQYLKSDENVFSEIYEILHCSLWESSQFSSKKIKRLRNLAQICLYRIFLFQKNKFISKIQLLIKEMILFSRKHTTNRTPYLLCYIYPGILFTITHGHLFFNKIDKRVNSKQLSIRFYIQNRMKIALDRGVVDQVCLITNIIINEISTSQFQIQNIETLENLLEYIYVFINYRFANQNHLPQIEPILILKCFEIFKMALEIGFKYQEWKKTFKFIRVSDQPLINVTIFQIKRALVESIKIRSFFIYLVKIGGLYKELNRYLRQNPRQKYFQFELLLQKGRDTLEKIFLPAEHIVFLGQLQMKKHIFSLSMQWIQEIKTNQRMLKMIKQYPVVKILFFSVLMVQIRKLGCDIKAEQIIRNMFIVNQNKPLNSDTRNYFSISNQTVAYEYFDLKIHLTNFDNYWCEQIIKLYAISIQTGTFYSFIYNQGYIISLFYCFVKTKKSYEQICQLLFQYTRHIKVSSLARDIQDIELHLNKLLWCDCVNCQNKRGHKFQITNLIETLYNQVDLSKCHINPYMSLVYSFSITDIHNMQFRLLKKQLYKKFLVYMIKSLNYMIPYAKETIKNIIYYFVYFLNHDLNLDVFGMAAWTKQNLQKYKISKKTANEREVRKFFYFFKHFIKNKVHNPQMIEDLIERRFVREYLIEGYRFPIKVKEMYQRKLRKYYYTNDKFRLSVQQYKSNAEILLSLGELSTTFY